MKLRAEAIHNTDKGKHGSVLAAPDSRKKQQLRLEKEQRRADARHARLLDDSSLAAILHQQSLIRVQAIWKVMQQRLGALSANKSIPQPNELETESGKTVGRDPLRQFYKRAYRGTMTADDVTAAVAHAFFLDKFETRADEACGALLCLWERAEKASNREGGDSTVWERAEKASNREGGDSTVSRAWHILCGEQRRDKSTVRVLSIGGGPGNDLAGFLVFNALVRRATSVHATVYDFSSSWQEIVEEGVACFSDSELAAADPPTVALVDSRNDSSDSRNAAHTAVAPAVIVPAIAINFALADLRAPIEEPVNQDVLQAAPEADFFLFSYVARESAAANYPLLGELLRRAKKGSVFIFLDPSILDVNAVTAVVEAVLPEQNYAKFPVGSHRLYPFIGVAFVVLCSAK